MNADAKLLADLRRASEECADQHGHYRDLMNSAADALEECSRYVSRDAVIEECAVAAGSWQVMTHAHDGGTAYHRGRTDAAKAIRGLKCES